MRLNLDAFCMRVFACLKTDKFVNLVAVCDQAWLSNEILHVSVYTCMCYTKLFSFFLFLILIWVDLFILPFCFVFLTGLTAPFCPIFVSVKGPGRKLSLPTDLKTDLGTVGRKRAELFLYSCLRCINFLCFHPVENDMMKPLVFAFYNSYLMHFYSFTFFSFEFMTWR